MCSNLRRSEADGEAVETLRAASIERPTRSEDRKIGRSEVGSRKSEVGSRKSEVGSRKSEVGSRKSEVGRQARQKKTPHHPKTIENVTQLVTNPIHAINTNRHTIPLWRLCSWDARQPGED